MGEDTLDSLAGWAVPPRPPARLLTAKDGRTVESIPLEKAVTVLGRHSTLADVVLDHASLSRQHCALVTDAAGAAYVVDLKSSHGTFVNGARLSPFSRRRVSGADSITVGGSSRVYTVDTGAATAAVADRAPDAAAPSAEASSSRVAREAEIAAMVASLSSTPVVTSLPGGGLDGRGESRAAGELEARATAAADDDDDEEEEYAAAAADSDGDTLRGLPSAFGSRKALAYDRQRVGKRQSASSAAAARDSSYLADGALHAARSSSSDTHGGAALATSAGSEYVDEGGDDAGADDDDLASRIPCSHEAVLGGPGKSVTALAFDASGARLATGGSDYTVRLYDFGSMDRAHRAFKEVTPFDGQPVHALSFSPSGDRFVVATGSAKARVYDRGGTPLITTVKGDPYITDMARTKGHVSNLTAAAWHPSDAAVVMTASLDGSVRFWNLGGKTVFEELQCGDVIKLRSTSKPRVGATAAALSPDGRCVLAAGDDGSLQLFHVKAPGYKYVRADASVRDAHGAGDTTAVCFSPDGNRVATRGPGDMLKVWDVRRMGGQHGSSGAAPSACTLSLSDVPALHATANCTWSPDGSLLLAGAGVRKGSGDDGRVFAWDIAAAEAVYGGGSSSAAAAAAAAHADGSLVGPAHATQSLAVAKGASVVVLAWHPRINQIAGGCSDGTTHVLFAPGASSNGALLSTARSAKVRDASADRMVSVSAAGMDVMLPNALPMYRDERLPKKMRFAEQEAAKLSDPRRIPALPVGEPEFVHAGTRTFTQYFMHNNATAGGKTNIREQDPVDVLRGYAAKAAGAEGSAWRAAYAVTQPGAHLASTTIEAEEEADREQLDRLLGAKGAAPAGGKK